MGETRKVLPTRNQDTKFLAAPIQGNLPEANQDDNSLGGYP